MKKLYFISSILLSAALVSCDGVQRKPSKVYMPDMAYSRAVETYNDLDSNLFTKNEDQRGSKIFYNSLPVSGTIARGEGMPFSIAKDKAGDTAGYNASKAVVNPVTVLNEKQAIEAERLYLVNCGICHGKNLDGNGPLYKGGEGPYPAKPATLVGDAKYEAMPEGQMFYSITYGKNLMGGYASQLSRQQRWEIVTYIKGKQKAAKATAEPAAKDSAAKK